MYAHRPSLIVAASVAFLVGCAERGTLSGPQDVSFQAVNPASAPAPFSLTILNPCNNELVDIAGWIQFRFDSRSDANGGSHTVARILEHGTGTGEVTGATYVFNADTIFNANAKPIEFGGSQSVNIRLLGQGQIPDFMALQVLHFVVNPNGDLVGVVDDFRTECR